MAYPKNMNKLILFTCFSQRLDSLFNTKNGSNRCLRKQSRVYAQFLAPHGLRSSLTAFLPLALTVAGLISFSPWARGQDLSYEDLIQELNFKRAKVAKFNNGESLAQKSLSLGMVSSLNQIQDPQSLQHPLMQGFEIGYSTDLGSRDLEGRGLFRYFFENNTSQSRTNLRELAFQVVQRFPYNRHSELYAGGGFSLRHMMHNSTQSSLNEVGILLNAVGGYEWKLSSASRLGFESGLRFPFGVAGRDRLALDFAIKLHTEIE